ncbi:MAG: hypothetical protein KDC24_00405 [Saprospiraceae bacterium]|nr:hypothetical protein [Saprospiraceae bacterium]
MLELDDKYFEKLEAIAGEIQGSEDLANYLEEEEEEFFLALKDQFEPFMAQLYDEVAENDPLQLVSLERAFLHEAFEGLFLPKILGYSVLRGEVKMETMKYVRTQEHFKEVLEAICNSANFDILRKRIGQSIQMGFALSSDIWVTNLIEEFDNKRIRYFLNSMRIDRYRRLEDRRAFYHRYWKQFKNDNFLTAEIPTSKNELQVLFSSLKEFLLYRVKGPHNNESIIPPLMALVQNQDYFGMREHLEIMGIFANFFELDKNDDKELKTIFNKVRNEIESFSEYWFELTLELHKREIELNAAADKRISELLDDKKEDELTSYYALMDVIHSKGYVHEDTQEAIKVYYNKHEGLSMQNECVRQAIFNSFARVINNIEPADYHELFEIAKYYGIYMQIFGNQKFNQQLEDLSMKYVRKLLKTYTDKRGKDYQDIKKFVSTSFKDLGFLTDKEVVALFKTRRKRKKEEE